MSRSQDEETYIFFFFSFSSNEEQNSPKTRASGDDEERRARFCSPRTFRKPRGREFPEGNPRIYDTAL